MTSPAGAGFDAARRFAHELADLADAITLPAFHGDLPVDLKDDGSPVTAADIGAERAMRGAILERFPGHAILGEEDGRQGPEDAPTWILDPIDGTKNFILGIPVYATLIALAVDDRPVLGVVSAPAMGSRWDGVVGDGARHNGHDIRVSERKRLADAQLCFGGLDHFYERGDGPLVERLTAASWRQRGFGDFWQHCLVASGGVDVAVEATVSRWDLAAVKAVVEAAGGRLTSLEGEDTDEGGNALSSNGLVHDEVLALIHEVRGTA